MEDSNKITRREFLVNLGVGFSFLVTFGSILYTALRYIYPPSKGLESGAKQILVGKIQEIPDGKAKEFLLHSAPAVVVNLKGEFKAFTTKCPHLGCIVKWDSGRGILVCPCHDGLFDLNGNVISGPPPRGLTKLSTFVKEDQIYVGRENS
ncbi:MAG: Rieske (2Fe-2S) protein [Armatimonadetes bacterium]|nr:Rieske (2Fe-2S) protein [Armatimonadota bacterium]